jgi:CHASE3 domain sensor protein
MDKEQETKTEQSERKGLLIFVGVVVVLVGLGVLFHLNTDQSTKSVQTYFEKRKMPEDYHQYKKEEESAKKKAERNIFLQD